jgi:hypothetical protein
MKICGVKAQFTPITFTVSIESQEELDYMKENLSALASGRFVYGTVSQLIRYISKL